MARFVSESWARGRRAFAGLRPSRHAAFALLPMLAGLAAGWQWLGMRRLFEAHVDPAPGTTLMLATVALVAAAVGPWLPERILMAGLRAVERWYYPESVRAEAAAGFWLVRILNERRPGSLWLCASLAAAGAGVVSVVALLLATPFFRLYEELLQRFMWTALTLTALEWAVAAVLLAAAWALTGLAAAVLGAAVKTGRPPCHRGGDTTAGLLAGLALGWALEPCWTWLGLSGQQIYLLGLLPMFGLAGVCAWLSQNASDSSQPQADQEEDAPELMPRGEGLIWLALAVWGIAGAMLLCGASVLAPPGYALTWQTLLALSVAGGAGVLYGKAQREHVDRCGESLWLAAVCSAGIVTAVSYAAPGSLPAWAASAAGWVLAGCLGYAFHELESAWRAREGGESFGLGQVLYASCLGSAMGLTAAQAWALGHLGPVGTMAMGTLVLIVLAGLMLIREPERQPHTNDSRIVMALASLAFATVVLPSSFGRVERLRVAQGKPAEGAVLDAAILSAIEEVERGARLCLVGVGLGVAANSRAASADILPLPFSELECGGPGQRVLGSATSFRTLRLERRKYGLIYQRGPALAACAARTAYSLEWFRLLAAHGGAGGRIIVDVPLRGATPEALGAVSVTFQHAVGSAGWQLVRYGDCEYLRLESKATGAAPPLRPVAGLCGPGGQPLIHSLNRDRLARLAGNPRTSLPDCRAWLESRQIGPIPVVSAAGR